VHNYLIHHAINHYTFHLHLHIWFIATKAKARKL
jgi:hypothetical protein